MIVLRTKELKRKAARNKCIVHSQRLAKSERSFEESFEWSINVPPRRLQFFENKAGRFACALQGHNIRHRQQRSDAVEYGPIGTSLGEDIE